MNCRTFCGLLLCSVAAFSSWSRLAIAADPPPPATAEDFAPLHQQWKKHLARFIQLRQQYQTDASADKPKLEAEAKQIAEQVQALMPRLIDAGIKAYEAKPNSDKELNDFMIAALADSVGSDNYELASQIAQLLVDSNLENQNLNLLAGLAFFNTNQFEAAEKHLQAAKDSRAINPDGLRLLESIPEYHKKWAREQKFREAEDKAGDLPKVKLQTEHGDIVIALFEDQAPNTVANFINLVEKKFYDGLTFHRVIPGFMAQGGDPKGDGSGGPGYTIPDEVASPDHREHFRGSLSMAKTQAPDSGGSQFFLCFVPTGHLDGQHTVFGRVVEGFDVLSKIQRTEGVPGRPSHDKILKATVVSKRPHEYKPVTRPER
jgi:cyclophilin family peptidyl-prolyl cis-trans isomerase